METFQWEELGPAGRAGLNDGKLGVGGASELPDILEDMPFPLLFRKQGRYLRYMAFLKVRASVLLSSMSDLFVKSLCHH